MLGAVLASSSSAARRASLAGRSSTRLAALASANATGRGGICLARRSLASHATTSAESGAVWRAPTLAESKQEVPSKPKSIEQLWHEVKRDYPGCLVMMQVGDFFEMLREDARLAADVLGITLTKRRVNRRMYSKDVGEVVDMSGIPVRALSRHLPKLANAGIRVVVVQQVQQPGKASSAVHRMVARVVTPGTVFEEELLQPGQNNFLVALDATSWAVREHSRVGIAWGDVSTGDLFVKSVKLTELREVLERIDAREILIGHDVEKARPPAIEWLWLQSGGGVRTMITPVDKTIYLEDKLPTPNSVPKISSSDENLQLSLVENRAVRCLQRYVNATLRPNFEWAVPRSGNEKTLLVDAGTRQALEITRSQLGITQGSLLNEVDYTNTALGARLLRSRLENPSTDLAEINRRHESVSFFMERPDELQRAKRLLKLMRDPARAFQRLRVGRGSQKDLQSVMKALEAAKNIASDILEPASRSLDEDLAECAQVMGLNVRVIQYVEEGFDSVLRAISARVEVDEDSLQSPLNEQSRKLDRLSCLDQLLFELKNAIPSIKEDRDTDNPPGVDVPMETPDIDEGDIEDDENVDRTHKRLFRSGYSSLYDTMLGEATQASTSKIDELRKIYQRDYHPKISLMRLGRQGASAQLAKAATGANQGVRYVIAVPKTVKLDPNKFFLVQSLKNRDRYTTRELDKLNRESMQSGELLLRIEAIILEFLTGHCVTLSSQLETLFQCIARVDVAVSSAEAALERNLTRPQMSAGSELLLEGVRHLVVAKKNPNFVSNDLSLIAGGKPSSWLITGPNMGGKSTFLRSCALSVILSQAGLFVPADKATVGLVDRVFARIGASDDIANNRSTFMVEMEETAHLLSQATRDSLVIVDELGRGTSPDEGYALAQACLEEIVNLGARCLFATHFHALAFDTSPNSPVLLFGDRLKRVTTQVITQPDGRIVFPYRMEPGYAKSSFGIQVAKIAGVPERVIKRAEELLKVSASHHQK